MPFEGLRVAVDDEATEIASSLVSDEHLIRNKGAAVCYLGGAAVTDATGYELGIGEAIGIALRERDGKAYAVCAAGQSTTLHVLTE